MERKRVLDIGGAPQNKRSRSENSSTNFLNGNLYSNRYFDILSSRKKLPVYQKREEILSVIAENQITLLAGETGSGKTTQIPQFLVERAFENIPGSSQEGGGMGVGTGCIACTQPRRVAAQSVARRVAQEMDVVLGEEVGYSIRFDDCTSDNTVLKYMTDGMLLREAMTDPRLSRYSVIILDEAHERTLATDMLFGLMKTRLLEERKDLKLVVMSATLDIETFSRYFNNAPTMVVQGRTWPVEILYASTPVRDYVEAAVDAVMTIHSEEDPASGDILLFLTGEEEIEDACKRLRELTSKKAGFDPVRHGELSVLPLYSQLPPVEQDLVFEPAAVNTRKCIVSTNIAETSLTIDGIVYVVDPGFVKMNVYSPITRVQSLQVTPISKASASQRSGRAGRTRPGKCFRLYTERSFRDALPSQTYAEIIRCNLSTVCLTLLKLGFTDLVHFDYMEPPAAQTMMRALESLHELGAVSDQGKLTAVGETMSLFPLDPLLSKMIIGSVKYECSNEILSIAALLSVPPITVRPPDKRRQAEEEHGKYVHLDGDHLTMLNMYHAYKQRELELGGSDSAPSDMMREWCYARFLSYRSLRSADSVRTQLKRLAERMSIQMLSPADRTQLSTSIRKSLIAGFFSQVAYMNKSGHYLTVKDKQTVSLHPSCNLMSQPRFVIFNEFIQTRKKFVRTCCGVKGEWLREVSPHYFSRQALKDDPEFLRSLEESIRMK